MNSTRILIASLFTAALAVPAAAQPVPPAPPTPPTPRMFVVPAMPSIAAMPAFPAFPAIPALPGFGFGWKDSADDRADDLYDRARDLIEQGKFDRAVTDLDRLIVLKSNRTDAAMYWKAYSLSKLGQRAEALTTLGDLVKQFGDSRWIRDAKALEVEVRQASGQPVSPASQDDEELKLMALRGIMQSDPDQALPVIEKMLTGTNSPKVKDRALFVLSQSRSVKAREIIAGVARGNANPDLQLRAIRYIGIMGGQENRQIILDIYKSSNDISVKRSILQSMFVGGDADKLIELAKNEKDPELRKTAIRNLGMMKRPGTTEALTAIYASDASTDVKKAVINALFIQSNAAGLVTLARAEKNLELKKEIVAKLSMMKSKEATEYLMELLK